MTALHVATAVFGLACACIAGWFVALRRLFAHLRDAHPAIYAELGQPSAFVRSTPATRRSTLHFLMTGRHTRLGDPRLARHGRMALAWLCAVVLSGGGAIALACLFPPGAA
ncbi:hypothetical protein [Cognatilysobacter segetis]|uniref:hypothetical protein n=1 Tax=Cognatilysobacter segetis TaxID=2492394 RepID=UPI00106118EF|nr:hypothetical protein [Lysobacter segetis]